MGRGGKQIIDNGIDKRELGYYSTPDFVSQYLTQEMLKINPLGEWVLDPAVGKEELLSDFYNSGKKIESFDIVDYGNHQMSDFKQENFIEFYRKNRENSKCALKYDYVIANPPYNCHEVSYIKDNRDWLKRLFDVGAYNMYSMFLSAMIDMAKEGCLIGVVISDSFLTSTYHSKLREKILRTCSLHQLILCPTNLFWSQKADVRTCIMILQKGKQFQRKVKIANRPQDVISFKNLLAKRDLKEKNIDDICLNCGRQFLVDVDSSIIDLFDNNPSLGSLYSCVTCVSTGNDSKYLSSEKRTGFSVPFYKNPASRKFKGGADAYLIDTYMDMHQQDKNFMVRNKSLIGKSGIACSSMGLPFSAVYLPPKAVTGVNPTIYLPEEDIYWMLSFLNSSLVTYLVRGVLIRSNMVTSGYVSSLPILSFTQLEKKNLNEIANLALGGNIDSRLAVEKVDEIIEQKGILSKETWNSIHNFCENLGRTV